MVGEAGDDVADVRAEGVGSDPERPGELAVFLGDADRDSRRDDHVAVTPLDTGVGDGTGGERVGAERSVRAVLFGAADGDDGQVGLDGVDVRPRAFGEAHTVVFAAGGV